MNPTVRPGIATKTAVSRTRNLRVGFMDYGMALVLLALMAYFSVSQPRFATWSNVQNLLLQMPALATLAVGQAFPIISGGFDLSVGSLTSVVSVVTAMVTLKFGLPAGILAGISVGGILGFINGWVISRLRILPFVQTLGMLSFASGLALWLTGGLPIENMPPSFSAIGTGSLGPFPIAAIVSFGIFALGWFLLERTVFGRYIYAIGGNEEAARIAGVPTARYVALAYTVCGLMTGVAGILLSSRVSSGIPTLGAGMELQAIASVVIGGVSLKGGIGRLPGVLLGVVVLSVIRNGLNLTNVSSYVQLMVTGLITVLAVAFDQVRTRSR